MKKENRIRFAKSFGCTFDVFSVFGMHKPSEFSSKQTSTNRWHLSAEGFLLLPSALRPHLLGSIKGISISLILIIQSFFITPVIAEGNSEPTAPGVNPDISKETSGSTASGVEGNVNTSKKGNADIGEGTGPSLTLSIPSSVSISALNPNTNNGFNSTSSNISISTTAPWGYELSVKAKDDNVLKNSASSTSKLESITTSIDENTFKTNNTYNNKWGFKPSKVNGGDNTNYIAGPTTSPIVIEKTSASNDSPAQYTIAIGAKADNTLATGTYSNNFTFTAVANTVSYTINYNLNSGSWTGTSPQSGSTTDKTVNISNVTPTRANYSFEGWCSTTVTNNSGSSPTCSGTKYSTNETYTLSSSTNTLNLYAMWKINTPTSMQDFNTYCDFMVVNQTINLKDTRDGNIYVIAKLLDGKCWMTQNLRLQNKQISSNDSDVVNGVFVVPVNTNNPNSSSTDVTYVHIPSNSAYGPYYNWYTATAGTGTAAVSQYNQNVTSSICPKGWKLPSEKEFSDLAIQYNAQTIKQLPANFNLSGYSNTGTADYDQGITGNWWTSTATGKSGAFRLYLDNSNLAVGDGDGVNKNFGYSIRCMAYFVRD